MLEDILKYLKPDAILHHDDWGGAKSTFMSPNMFADFFVEPYKKIYKYCHDNGVELVIHHADVAATLVPYYDMGIETGRAACNPTMFPRSLRSTGGKNSSWATRQQVSAISPAGHGKTARKDTRRSIDRCGSKYFFTCIVQGGPVSDFPGVL